MIDLRIDRAYISTYIPFHITTVDNDASAVDPANASINIMKVYQGDGTLSAIASFALAKLNPPNEDGLWGVSVDVSSYGIGIYIVHATATVGTTATHASGQFTITNEPKTRTLQSYVSQVDVYEEGSKVVLRHYEDGVLTDVTGSVKFGDSTASYGVKETVAGIVRIAALATALTKTATGVYEYDLSTESWYSRTTAYTYALTVDNRNVTDYVDDESVPAVTAPAASSLCTVYGYVKDPDGGALEGATVSAYVRRLPSFISGSAISDTHESTTTNASGYFELQLVRTAVVQLVCEEANYSKEVTVPSAATSDWEDL